MIKNFDEVFEDVTKRGTKIKTDEYRLSGKHQIIDQGQEQVAGYTDLEDGVFENIPAIIFGDHTRIVKYIDKPFFLGADGVKVLRSRFQDANYRYLYYALKYVKIPNTGYNRHFKWLKESKIQYPCAEKQEEIVSVLNGVSKIIEYRQQQLQKLDELVKARFVEMFGDPMTDISKWSTSTIGEQFNVTSGGTPATGEKAYWENGTIPWIGSNMCQDMILSGNDGKFITEEGYTHSSAKWFHKGTVLVALVGATIGKTALLRFDTTTNQNIAAIDVNNNVAFSSEFVFYHMQMLYSKFMEIGSGKFKMANQGFIRQLPLICPPIELQDQFATFVEQTDKSKSVVQKALDEAQLLFDSLMQQYFG